MAKLNTSIKLILVVIETIKRGKSSLIPKTAIKIPTVKNVFFQKLFQFFIIEAFTIALSKDKEISIRIKIIVNHKTFKLFVNPPFRKAK